MDAPPLTLRQIDADTLPTLQALYDASADYFLRHGGGPARPDQALIDFQNTLASGDRALLGVWWQRTELIGCFDLRFGHPQPGVVWFGALILADALPAPRFEIESWAVRILEAWLRLGTDAEEVRLALLVSDRERVRFWTDLGYRASGAALRQVVGDRSERVVIYHKTLRDAAS